MVDKNFCLSSYIAFRYLWKDGVEFAEGFRHTNYAEIPKEARIPVRTPQDIDREIRKQFDELYGKYDRIGILLSGGMDSANLAAYLKPGSHAYTFTSETGVFSADVERAKKYCNKFRLQHHLVDITFADYKKYAPIVMRQKCAPVHSIEPQIYKAAIIAQKQGIECLIIGDGADYVFGGMDKLLSKDWKFDEFVRRYMSLDPNLVLCSPVDMTEPFEPYRIEGNKIDYLRFMENLCTIESYSSYDNAFATANMDYYDPYAKLVMAEPLDLQRVRNGEPKYLIRGLYALKYPELEIPFKIPMPRPVDTIFKDWAGPVRPEFRKDIPMDALSGNQKWQLWCAQEFLNIID